MAEGTEYAFPRQIEVGHQDSRGMTLRDYFAGQAIAGFLPGPDCGSVYIAQYAKRAYAVADAMLAERAK